METKIKTPTIDDVRDYWDERPCNSNHSDAEFMSRRYFQEVRQKRRQAQPHIFDFQNAHHWRGKNVLEIGCGIGSDAFYFALHGANLTCVDISKNSLDMAKGHLAIEGFHAEFIETNMDRLHNHPYFNRSVNIKFDLVYACGVLHHTSRPHAALSHIKACMRNDSELKILVYSKWSTKNLAIKLGLSQPEAQAGCPIARTYSKKEIHQLLEGCGFEIISIEKEHIFQWKLEDYKAGRFVKKWYWRFMPKPIFNWFRRNLGWHLLIRARIARETASDAVEPFQRTGFESLYKLDPVTGRGDLGASNSGCGK